MGWNYIAYTFQAENFFYISLDLYQINSLPLYRSVQVTESSYQMDGRDCNVLIFS